MAVLRRPYARARRLAREVLWECGVDEPSKIDPFTLTARHRIVVIHGRLDGATAQILRHGERAIIRVSDQIVQVGRLRFTLAHELGHYLLGHRIPSDLELRATAPFSAHQEREADVFATEYLMPELWVVPLCAGPPSLDAVHSIATTFRTSLVASAVRFVELAPTPCAVVYSESGIVVWAKRSRTFPGRVPPQLRIGGDSNASHLHDRTMTPREVPASAFLGTALSTVPRDATLVEHSALVPEPGWGGMLSLLAVPDSYRSDVALRSRGSQP